MTDKDTGTQDTKSTKATQKGESDGSHWHKRVNIGTKPTAWSSRLVDTSEFMYR